MNMRLDPHPLCPPDMDNNYHVMDNTRPSPFFAALPHPCIVKCQCKPKNRERGRPGNEATTHTPTLSLSHTCTHNTHTLTQHTHTHTTHTLTQHTHTHSEVDAWCSVRRNLKRRRPMAAHMSMRGERTSRGDELQVEYFVA